MRIVLIAPNRGAPRVFPPVVRLTFRQRRRMASASIGQPLREPAPEARYRRQGGEALQLRKLRLELLDNLLDQEIAERNAAQPVLAIRDRIEDRRVGARGLCPRRFLVPVL